MNNYNDSDMSFFNWDKYYAPALPTESSSSTSQPSPFSSAGSSSPDVFGGIFSSSPSTPAFSVGSSVAAPPSVSPPQAPAAPAPLAPAPLLSAPFLPVPPAPATAPVPAPPRPVQRRALRPDGTPHGRPYTLGRSEEELNEETALLAQIKEEQARQRREEKREVAERERQEDWARRQEELRKSIASSNAGDMGNSFLAPDGLTHERKPNKNGNYVNGIWYPFSDGFVGDDGVFYYWNEPLKTPDLMYF
ncbi:hypothetical protein GLAREA_01078 [Glarea lozoyensis ATCC 20868]|uniref:Uncharacterized protein n=1 Tax=Glarea lozoyensis (strain ATCC 20868 / MF5171) TaxID=1116229 RepID=S3DU37_GLAL2|nr:uncharacterized protein GLAREA_01078 [Glarea lozoyensis ATCC 20868]EPE29918.1 hypothetical protein GLAREA_01078 [Glarea lozoyensis ATCC 20868]